MPLDIDEDTESFKLRTRKPKKKKVKVELGLAPSQEIRDKILKNPRVLGPDTSQAEIMKCLPMGILGFEPRMKPKKFRFNCSYDERATIKKIPFAGWHPKKKVWVLPISIETIRVLKKYFPNFYMSPDAFLLVHRLIRANQVEHPMIAKIRKIKSKEISSDHIVSYGKFQPWELQKICIHACKVAWENGYGFGNFCEQGLGKTCMGYVAVDHEAKEAIDNKQDFVAVIYAPKGILFTTWVADCLKFTKHIRPLVLNGPIKARAASVRGSLQYHTLEEYEVNGIKRQRIVKRSGRPNVFLINHEAGRSRDRFDKNKHNPLTLALIERIQSSDNSVVIVDEVDKFSNPSAKQTKAAAEIINAAKKTLMMTGTPGMPEKFFGILQLIDKRIFNVNRSDFMRRYTSSIELDTHDKIVGYKNLDELRRRSDQFSCRFLQEDCADIPPYTTVELKVELSKAQREAYDSIAEQIEVYYENNNITKTSIAGKLHGLRNICNGFVKDSEGDIVRFKTNPKLDLMIENIEKMLEADLNHPEHIRKVFIVCQYREDVEIVLDELDRKIKSKKGVWEDLHYHYIHGDVKDEGNKTDRSDAVLAFRQDPKAKILVSMQTTISHGHHLVPELPQVCDATFHFSLSYDPNGYDQTVKRTIRKGQTRHVTIYQMLCEGTIDETIADALKEKKDICSKVNGDSLRSVLRGR